MLGFKSFIVEGIADANSLMTHDSKLRSAGYTRVGSFAHPTNGKQVHTYQTGKGKNIQTTHLHVKQGVVHKIESHAGRPDLLKVKQSLGEDVETINEGWFFGNSYKRIGNKGATHRITVKHVPTGKKHTFDVTAPTDRHAWDHVNRHFHGGRRGDSLAHVRTVHLHEDLKESAPLRHEPKSVWPADKKKKPVPTPKKKPIRTQNDDVEDEKHSNMNEMSIRQAAGHVHAALQHGAAKAHLAGLSTPDNLSSGPGGMATPFAYGAAHAADHLTGGRISGAVRGAVNSVRSRFKHEDLDEALEIKHAINHLDRQARHHARKYKEHQGEMSKITNNPEHSHEQALNYQKHAEDAIWHHREYKKRLGQLEAGQHVKNEDLDEGLVSRITNAAKNLNKRTQFPTDRFDGAEKRILKNYPKNTESKAKALKKVEMHRVRDMARRSTDDSEMGGNSHLDHLAGRHMGIHAKLYGKDSAARQLNKAMKKMNEAQKEGVTVAIPVDVGGKRYSAVNGQAYVHSTMIMGNGRWNTSKRQMARKIKPGPHHDKIIAALEKHKAERYKNEDLVAEGRFASVPKMAKHYAKQKWMADFNHHVTTKTPEHSGKIDWDTATHLHNKGKTPEEAAYTYHRINMKHEDLQELSKKTLGSYVKKAHVDGTDHAQAAQQASDSDRHYDRAYAKKYYAKVKNRRIGINRAADKLAKEDLAEGLRSKITNAAKNLYKKSQSASTRIAQTREKVGFDNAKGKDLSPRGNALRKVERIEWSKANPVKKKKDIVPMGKVPGSFFEEKNTLVNRTIQFVTEGHTDLQELSKHTLMNYVNRAHHSGVVRTRAAAWNNREVKDNNETVLKIRKSSKLNRYQKGIRTKVVNRDTRYKQADADWNTHKAANQVKGIERATRKLAKEDLDEGRKLARPKKYSSPRPGGSQALSGMGGIAGMGRYTAHPDPEVNAHAKKAFDAYTSRKFSEVDHHLANAKAAAEKSTYKEELDPKGGRKLLKELPKRGADGKLSKSKTAQKVEDCIKMSGKKEKIDTEPTLNNLTTPGIT